MKRQRNLNIPSSVVFQDSRNFSISYNSIFYSSPSSSFSDTKVSTNGLWKVLKSCRISLRCSSSSSQRLMKLKFLPKKLLVSKNLRTFAAPVPAKPLNDAQMCGSFYFLYISLAEILVFSNDSYFFVNIENMEENGNMLIIKELWICWLIALK